MSFKIGSLASLDHIADSVGRMGRRARCRTESPRATTFATGMRDVTRSTEVFSGDGFEDVSHIIFYFMAYLEAEALCYVGQVFCVLVICHELVVEGFVVDHEL